MIPFLKKIMILKKIISVKNIFIFYIGSLSYSLTSLSSHYLSEKENKIEKRFFLLILSHVSPSHWLPHPLNLHSHSRYHSLTLLSLSAQEPHTHKKKKKLSRFPRTSPLRHHPKPLTLSLSKLLTLSSSTLTTTSHPLHPPLKLPPLLKIATIFHRIRPQNPQNSFSAVKPHSVIFLSHCHRHLHHLTNRLMPCIFIALPPFTQAPRNLADEPPQPIAARNPSETLRRNLHPPTFHLL